MAGDEILAFWALLESLEEMNVAVVVAVAVAKTASFGQTVGTSASFGGAAVGESSHNPDLSASGFQ